MSRRRLLWVGDAGVSSGFARATHKILEVVHRHWDVFVLGINYWGDPHPYPYPIFPARNTPIHDPQGVMRIPEMMERIGPSVIVVQQDPWNFKDYLHAAQNVPVVGVVAVDGTNCRGRELNGLSHAIFWTNYGETEARKGGYTGSASVIPLGVDTKVYYPKTRTEARTLLRIPRALTERGLPAEAFIVGSVGRNQPRKRLDLTIQYFAEWIHQYRIDDACLWLHIAPTGDDAYDLSLLGRYYGVGDRLMIPAVQMIYGFSEETLSQAYSVFDVLLNTSQGEGWWLPGIEAMACGTALLVPDWAALRADEWIGDAALRVPCTSNLAMPPRGITSIGGVMDKAGAIEALQALYSQPALRAELVQRGLGIVQQPQFNWQHIGERYVETLESLFQTQPVAPLEVEV